jgi:hypothetical protein
MAIDMSDYVDVAERLRDFRAEHPEGSLRPADPARPYWIETVGDKTFVVYAAAAYRNPGDPAPGIGVAWEPFPGKSSFTRDSELMNAETSAWGRAILAVGSSSAKRIASANEVRNRREDEASPAAVEPPNARAPESPGSAPAAGAVSAIAIRKQLAELAHARAFLTAEGSVDARKAQAALDTEQHSLDAEVAEAAVRTARQEMRTITTRIEVGRTLVSSARAEMTNFVGAS